MTAFPPRAWGAFAATLALSLLGTVPAHGGGKFLGETVVHRGDGGHEAWLVGQSQDVGYKYDYLAFLWIDLWSWGGTYCVHQRFEHKYTPISQSEAARLLGKSEADLRPPFGYRYPPGLLIFGPICAIAAAVRVRREWGSRHRPEATAPRQS